MNNGTLRLRITFFFFKQSKTKLRKEGAGGVAQTAKCLPANEKPCIQILVFPPSQRKKEKRIKRNTGIPRTHE
jgi:hypothetical protein